MQWNDDDDDDDDGVDDVLSLLLLNFNWSQLTSVLRDFSLLKVASKAIGTTARLSEWLSVCVLVSEWLNL